MQQGYTFFIHGKPAFFIWNGVRTVVMRWDPMGDDVASLAVEGEGQATEDEVLDAITKWLAVDLATD